MAILDLFLSPIQKKGKSHLKNLFQIALADGKIENTELKFLKTVSYKYNITESEFEKLLSDASSSSGNFNTESTVSRFEQIYDLVKMMMIDNDIAKEELEMCVRFAEKMGFERSKAVELVDSIRQNIAVGNNMDDTKLRVLYLLRT